MAEQQKAISATKQHCKFAFDVLVGHLTDGDPPLPSFPDAHCPLFVTWNKSNWSGHTSLRGCIGTLEPRRLHVALRDYALTSALRDSRFSPVELRELSHLSCGVSLLTEFEKAQDWEDWEVGVHGIIIEFTDPVLRSRRSATFLPEVAAEQCWTRQHCVDSLVRKAGYSGEVTSQLRRSLKVTRYQSSKASLTYGEYMKLTEQEVPPENVAVVADGLMVPA